MKNIDLNRVLNAIKPTKEEKEKVMSLSNKLINVINDIARENGIDAEAVLVGSVAKDTWLHARADIDIFIKFPLNTSENDLKELGLKIGYKCIQKMHGKHELRFASHPYVTGFIEGYEIDFVPCYTIENADELKSAVDRTILHTEYVNKKLKEEQKDEVLLLKKFMESIHTYSAEAKVGGFSGYLCELLIINYGTFVDVLETASEKWSPKTTIDIENYRTAKQFHEPVVVIDPTDKNRNVSAALTLQKISEFIVASRNFLDDPKVEYFCPEPLKPDINIIRNDFLQRGTKTLLILFKPPDVPADALYPQIKKTESSLRGVVEREDFRVLDTDSWTDENDKVIILLELDVWNLPSIKKHYGPPIWSKEHQKRFISKYKDKAYVEEDKWVVQIDREYNDAESLIKDILEENKIGLLRFGKHIKNKILNKHQIIDILDYLESGDSNEDELLFFHEYLNGSIYLRH
ncbi:MAG: CCA tRNA nucleotidyltransferase [Methanobacterium sp.]